MGSEYRECGKRTKGASEKQHPHSKSPPSSRSPQPVAWVVVTGVSLSNNHAFSFSKSSSFISLSFPFPVGIFALMAFTTFSPTALIVICGAPDFVSVVSWM